MTGGVNSVSACNTSSMAEIAKSKMQTMEQLNNLEIDLLATMEKRKLLNNLKKDLLAKSIFSKGKKSENYFSKEKKYFGNLFKQGMRLGSDSKKYTEEFSKVTEEKHKAENALNEPVKSQLPQYM